MNERRIDTLAVDVCTECRGLWIDWFDGDTLTVAQMSAPLSMRAPTPMRADARCPRCTRPLEARNHEAIGPVVHRCIECAGTFVPREVFDALVAFEPPRSEHPHEEKRPPEPGAPIRSLEELIARVAYAFGLKR